jgi:hypothetical protein
VVLKSTKSAQVPSTSVVPNVLPKQILLYYKIRTKKYANNKKKIGTVQHFKVRQEEDFLVRQREDFLVHQRADFSVHI